MIEKLSFTTVLANFVIKTVQDGTQTRCYDSVPKDIPYSCLLGGNHRPDSGSIKNEGKGERYQIVIHVC